MSIQPNNPFENPQPTPVPVKKGGNKMVWILGILGGLSAVGVLVCCGGGYLMFRAGTGVLSEAFKAQLEGNPVIAEHLGHIETMDINFTRTGQESQGGQERLAFDVEGPKGSGVLIVVQDQTDGTSIQSAELVLRDGTRLDVPLDWVPQDLEVEFGDPETIDAPIDVSGGIR